MICHYCGEAFLPGEPRSFIFVADGRRSGFRPLHHECWIRSTIGSVGHQMHICSCYGGDIDDPPGATRREAAKAAFDFFNKVHGVRNDLVDAGAARGDGSLCQACADGCEPGCPCWCHGNTTGDLPIIRQDDDADTVGV